MERGKEEKGIADVHSSRYADLMLDWTFKRVFGENGDKGLLISLLESILDIMIEDLEYLPQEITPEVSDGKEFRLDLRCRCKDGKRVIVEIQTYRQEYFFRRCIAYAAAEYATQSRRGATYGSLEPVCLVALMSERASLPHGKPISHKEPGPRGKSEVGYESQASDGEKVVHRYMMMEKDSGELLFDTISATFVELGRFRKEESECTTLLDKWLYVLKNMKRLERLPSTFSIKVFERLFQAVDIKRFNREDMDAYYRFWFAEMDREDMIQTARKEGHSEGVAEGRIAGIAEGIAEGRAEGVMATARNMKAIGIEMDFICECTGLSAEQVEAL